MIYILTPDFETVQVIDDYYSLVWAERYTELGDFEVELPITHLNQSYLALGNLVQMQGVSQDYMVIQSIKPNTSTEKGSIIVSGENLATYLKTRYIQTPFGWSGNAEQLMLTVVDEHLINPSDSNRDIPGFWTIGYLGSTPTYANQFDRISVYELCREVGRATGLGFSVGYFGMGGGCFYVYEGTNRSFTQTDNPFVIFAEEYDNVVSGSYYTTTNDQINLVHVFTDDPVHSHVEVWIPGMPEPSGVNRFEGVLETSVDRDMEDPPLSDAQVLEIIQQKGRDKIIESRQKGYFAGDFDIESTFVYGIDFFLGDIVQVKIHTFTTPARVVEVVRTWSSEGYKIYMTLDFINVIT